jgi:rfaE bifunctional protein kinase chain/domain
VHSAKQQVVRIDREAGWPLVTDVGRTFVRKLGPALADCDAVVLSDYGSGLVTPALASAIRARIATRARRRPVPVLLDSRYRLLDYRALTICTPNESEVEQVLDLRIDDDPDALERAGRAILRRTRMRGVLITRGSRGMALFEHKQPTIHVPIFGSDEIADVTGAGDTVIATCALALAAGASFYEAALLANYAGGVVVMKRGTATVNPRELSAAVETDHDTSLENWSQEGPAQGRRK